MTWFTYFRKALLSVTWVAVWIAFSVVRIFSSGIIGTVGFPDILPSLGILILQGLAATAMIAVAFSLVFATVYTIRGTR